MINKQAIFRKSAKGTEAIAVRQPGFAPKLRSALIMVDGKRSFNDLLPMLSVLGDPEVLMGELEAAGLIEQAADFTPTVPGAFLPGDAAGPASTVPPPVAVPAAPATLASARRFTTRLLTELLGPMAETLCVKIEAARDMNEFIAAVKRARDVVREVQGQQAATQFTEQVEAHAPLV